MANRTELRSANHRPSSGGSKKLNVVMSDMDWQRLNRVAEMMETNTTTDAVKEAFRLLEFFVKTSKSGGKFYVRMDDGELERINILGVTD